MRRLALAVVVTLLVASGCSDGESSTDTTLTAAADTTVAPGEPEGTVSFTDLEQTHVDTPVDYAQDPPVGGPHSADWQTCQFYDVEFPKERGVHSLEHGAVWITYTPDLPLVEVSLLSFFSEDADEVLISPFTGLPSPIVVSAWGKQLHVDSPTDGRIAQFIQYFENGPQTPELGTPCAGGTTDTD